MKTASGASDSFAAVAMRPRAGVSELRSGLGGITEGVVRGCCGCESHSFPRTLRKKRAPLEL